MYSFSSLAIFSILGFITGFLIRVAINAKQKRKILKLEDEMLKNHSNILKLETKISSLEKEKAELSEYMPRKASGLKLS
jgi:hypothetical protein